MAHVAAPAAPSPLPIWLKVFAAVVPTILVIGGIIWAIARYPDRDEFEATVDGQQKQIKEVRSDLSQLQLNQVKVRADIEAIRASGERQERAQDEIRQKLDRVLEERRRR